MSERRLVSWTPVLLGPRSLESESYQQAKHDGDALLPRVAASASADEAYEGLKLVGERVVGAFVVGGGGRGAGPGGG